MGFNFENWLYKKANSFSRFLILTLRKFLLNYRENFQEKLPEGAKIITPNHPTTIDPFMMLLLTKEPSYVLIWDTIFKVPFFGKIFSYLKHIPVNPEYGIDAYQKALKYLKEGKTIIVFPEGNLTPTEDSLIRVKTGAVRLAKESGAPIIPVGIGLSWPKIRKKDSDLEDAVLKTRFYNGPYVVGIGRPLYYKKSKVSREEVRRLSGELMEKIENLKKWSDNEVEMMLTKKAHVKFVFKKAFSFALYQLILAIIVK